MKILRLAALVWMAGALGANLFGQVLTWHNDNFRTGQNLQETALTPANVNASTFGRLFTIGVDGRVDAEPLYVPGLAIPGQGIHNVLYVVTEHDSVYAFDADTGTQLWHVSMLLMSETPSDDRGCGQVTPEIGVTSTPAIDQQAGPHGTMYVVAMSKNGSTYHQRLHALDLTTGGEQFGGPMEVMATYTGTGDGSVAGLLTFDPKQYKERAGLLISNGVVYTSWASHCDIFPYTAWVIGYNELTLSRVSILNLTPNGSDGSVWAAGAGPAADASGNIFLLMANGTFDTTLDGNSFPNKQDYGNAFVKINTGGTVVGDYFTMSNTVSESSADQDLGSGGAILLPSVNDTLGHPRDLAVGAGKDHHIYVVDRANMGKFNMSSNAIYQDLPSSLADRVFSSPAWFNGTLYYGAVGDRLKAFAFAGGMFGSSPASQSATGFGYPGTTPSISANGTANGIVWAAENTNPAVLHAYDATNLATELYNTNMAANSRDHFGAGNKFIVPMVANGKVYVGTTNGVGVFGFLCGTASVPVPANNATGVALSPTLSWTAATGAVSYDVALSTTNPPGVVATGLTSTSYPVSTPLASATKYYWYVITHNCTGSAQSPTWSFTTAGGSVGQPVETGIFRNSGIWILDVNGDGVVNYSNLGVDRVFQYTATAGDIAVTGDWNGDGRTKTGIFRNGLWILDANGNGVVDNVNQPGGDLVFQYTGSPGDIPVVGDWNGDGRTKTGVFRNGLWILDVNGDGVVNYANLGVDKIFQYTATPGDIPIVGDWSGDGKAKTGVFRNNGVWILDVNGDGVINYSNLGADKVFQYTATAGDLPVIGDWNGDGRAKTGVFRNNGIWILDVNGDGVVNYSNLGVDRVFQYTATAGDLPVIGDWNGDGKSKTGVFRNNGVWIIDVNGDGVINYSNLGVDKVFQYTATPGDKPLVGRW